MGDDAFLELEVRGHPRDHGELVLVLSRHDAQRGHDGRLLARDLVDLRVHEGDPRVRLGLRGDQGGLLFDQRGLGVLEGLHVRVDRVRLADQVRLLAHLDGVGLHGRIDPRLGHDHLGLRVGHLRVWMG